MDDSGSRTEQKISREAGRIREGFEKARQQASALTEKAVAEGEEAIKDAKHRGKKVWDESVETGEEIFDEALELGEEKLEGTKSFFRRHSTLIIGSLVGILAVGGLTGWWVAKKR